MKSEDSVLAAIAGYVDTLSFVALFGLFTAHVTGNFVLVFKEARATYPALQPITTGGLPMHGTRGCFGALHG